MKKPKMLQEADVAKIKEKLNHKDRTIFALACQTGLRISDILNLKNKDISQNLRFSVFESKTKKIKECELSPALWKHLMYYYASELEFMANYYVFAPIRDVNSEKKHYSRQNYWRHLKNVCKTLKIDISPHSTRKYYAMQLYQSTHNIDYVRRMLNHKYISTTFSYLDIDLTKLLKNK